MSKLDIKIHSKPHSEQFREVIRTLSGSLDAATIPKFEREIAALIHLLLKKTFFNHNRALGQAEGRATEGWPRRGETSGRERVKGHRGELQAERKNLQGLLPFFTCCETSFSTPCSPWLVPLESRRTQSLLIG
jgi:hypothetical protein